MQAVTAYEPKKYVSLFDECSDDSWTVTPSSYGHVTESRRAYHVIPPVLRISNKDERSLILPQQRKVFSQSVEQEFRALAEKWRDETMELSSTTSIVTNFNYYRIIGLGKEVVPLILRELETKGGQWYLALRVLANENPVNPQDAGNIKKMKQTWIDWGKARGLI